MFWWGTSAVLGNDIDHDHYVWSVPAASFIKQRKNKIGMCVPRQHMQVYRNVIFESDILNNICLFSNIHWGLGAFNWVNSQRRVGRMILKSLRTWPLKLALVGSTLRTQEWSVGSAEGFNVMSKPCEGWFLQTHVTVGDKTATFLPCVPGRNLKSISLHLLC